MTIALHYTHITVNDVDESLAFYRDALGLEVQNDVSSGAFRWVTLGSPTQPGVSIVLSVPHAGRSQADGDVAARVFEIVSLNQPSASLIYGLSEPHAGRSQADGDALQELLTKGVLPMIIFRTDDVDATFETVRASGAEVLQEPMDQGWGPRDCAFRDPSGNTVRIAQAPAA